MNVRTTMPASDLLRLQPSRKIIKTALGLGLNVLEKYFGSSALLEVPSSLQGISPELLPAIEIASRIKSLGMTGEIRKISKMPDEPFLFRYTTYPTANGSGSDFASEESAIWKTLGETIERVLWGNSHSFYRKKVIRASYGQIRGKSIDIFSLAGFFPEQRQHHKNLSFDEKTNFSWLKVSSLTSRKKIFCPVQLLSSRYWRENVKTLKCESKPEPMLRWAVTTGLATGQSLEEAILKGILEIIERDAYMITYLNKLSPPEISLENLSEQDQEIKKVLLSFKRYHLEPHLFSLPTDFSVPVIFALTMDGTGFGPALTVGASADYDAKSAILDALAESLSVRLSIKNFFRQEIDSHKIGRWERMIYWANPDKSPKMDFLLKGKKIDYPSLKKRGFFTETLNKKERREYYKRQLESIIRQFRSKNYELVYADITTKEIKALGLRCVYVLSPQLQPMHLDESIPYLGGKRLREVPLKLGYEPAEELNEEPHPFP